MPGLLKITDKINLPTSVTAMETISRLLRVVVDNEPLTSADSKPLFMAAKARGIRKKASVADTHTEGTLKTFGLISYVENGAKFVTTPLGKEIAESFDDNGPLVDEDELTELALRVVCAWRATNSSRDIHPGRILLDLLCDDDLDGYVTEHEYTNFLIDQSTKLDSQYAAIKQAFLNFRAKGADAICVYTETCKTYLFLPAFVNKWHLLKKGRVFDFEKKGTSYRWTMGVVGDGDDCEDELPDGDDDSSTLFSKWSHVTEFRLLPKAKELYLDLKNGNKSKKVGIMKNRQKIVYGAPGTGKSSGVNDIASKLPKENVIRTTFHPDSDYSTFVGAYKPKMDTVPLTRIDGDEIKKVTKGDASLLTEKHISYEFVPQAFAKAYVQAWKKMATPEADGKVSPVMLVVEEINRGDCAKIFGDLFQLLDRLEKDDKNDPKKKAGFSEYPVLADSDLADYIRRELDAVKNAPIFKDYPFVIASENLELLLPPNMYIWATMNTSDQSLFPMDSAFKRRWDWEYVPIEDKGKDWKIKVGADEYNWWSFLKQINDEIADYTSSEDKQLGYFFAQPGDGGTVIDTETFVSKVIFYLWKDVFRDDLPQGEPFKFKFKKGDEEKEREIRFTDFYQADLKEKLVGHFLEKIKVEKVAAKPSGNTGVETSTETSGTETVTDDDTAN